MGKTILVVEDRTDAREMLKMALAKSQYQVLGAADGEDALKVLRMKNVDLVIADVRMPEIGGMELLKVIRSDTEMKKLKVIMLTAFKTAANERKLFFDAGADAFLLKPVDIVKLREVIKRMIG